MKTSTGLGKALAEDGALVAPGASFQDREKIVATGEFLKRDSRYAA